MAKVATRNTGVGHLEEHGEATHSRAIRACHIGIYGAASALACCFLGCFKMATAPNTSSGPLWPAGGATMLKMIKMITAQHTG
jgi:hypothetical protein